MKFALMAVALGLQCALAANVLAAVPEKLLLGDLVNHPERWPAEVTAKSEMQFGGGLAIKAGQKLRLADLQGQDVVVEVKPENMAAISAEECDLLEAANAQWSTLTPEQKELDFKKLANDATLWPEKVKCFGGFNIDGGKTIPAGQELYLSTIDAMGGISIYCEDPEARLSARVTDTDLISRARELAKTEPAKRKSRIVEALRGKMIDSKGNPVEPAGLESAKLIVVYHGASWCGPCQKFSPTLVKFVSESGKDNPGLFVVMLSADTKDKDLFAYAEHGKMPWPLVTKENVDKMPLFKSMFSNFIPHLLVLDHNGKVLASSEAGGRYDNQTPMRVLAKLVKDGAAK